MKTVIASTLFAVLASSSAFAANDLSQFSDHSVQANLAVGQSSTATGFNTPNPLSELGNSKEAHLASETRVADANAQGAVLVASYGLDVPSVSSEATL